ncbi:MAG: 3-alpha,7-alpha,12-alpha-trihydroxy-5-beta-cholest-24-enoyl-CoA hydratase [Burkholderiales bacterium PBB5]|nr:MAG: 3-alpha,7-alpha,12-alpha-trihydroxy-5-beta-cholest-24-enoyl-CoA hydratase [Burkholderiales bacterium PBB5]
MATYTPRALLPTHEPGPWSAPVPITYTQRDVLLYAVGIGIPDLRFIFEQHPQFAVFPTFAIRWGGAGLQLDPQALPPSPGPLTIDAERRLEQLAPLPLDGTVQARSRLLAVHPRGKGNAFVEIETEVQDAHGQPCVRLTTGLFRRGVAALGDIAPFEGAGISRSAKVVLPERAPDLELQAPIAANQAQLYRLSGDYNPLHIDPAAAQFGGFPAPILHGLCTYGHCGQLLLGALCGGDAARFGTLGLRFSSPVFPGETLRLLVWHQGPGQVVFEGRVADRVVVSNASFSHR